MPVNVISTLQQALRQLQSDRSRIDRQIAAIRSALDGVGRQGGTAVNAPGRRRRRGMSAAARRAASQRMKAYWAKRRSTQSSAKGGRK